ncbi:MAG: GumC family protein [Candidatus Methylomirabilales bacterium]
MEEQEVELIDYLNVIWRRKGLILGGTLLAVVTALVVSLNTPRTYEVSVTMLVTESKVPSAEGRGPAKTGLSPETFEGMIRNKSLAEKAIQKFGLDQEPYELTPRRFLDGVISVKTQRQTNLIHLTVQFPDAKLAKEIANFLAEQAVELNTELNRADTLKTRDYIKKQLDGSRTKMERAQTTLVQFQREAHLATLRKEIEVLLAQKTNLGNKYREALFHIEELKASPLKARLEEAEARLLQFRRRANLASLRADREFLLQEKNRLAYVYSDVATAVRGHQAKLKELSAQIKEHQKVETIVKSIEKEPGFLAAAGEENPGSKRDLLALQMKSEEFNPVYRNTEQALITTRGELASLEARRDDLKGRLVATGKKLGAVDRQLAEKELELDRLKREFKLAEEEWVRQVGGSMPATTAHKKVLEEELRETEDQLIRLQVEQANKEARLEELIRNYTLAKDAYQLFARKHEEASLSVASRVNDLKILDRAVVPRDPIKRKVKLNVALAGTLGLMMFTFLAFFLEYIEKARGREGEPLATTDVERRE